MYLFHCMCRKIGKYITVCGKTCINVASLNFLGMSGRNDIEVRCLAVDIFLSYSYHVISNMDICCHINDNTPVMSFCAFLEN